MSNVRFQDAVSQSTCQPISSQLINQSHDSWSWKCFINKLQFWSEKPQRSPSFKSSKGPDDVLWWTHGSGPIQVQYKSGWILVQVQFRSGSGRVQTHREAAAAADVKIKAERVFSSRLKSLQIWILFLNFTYLTSLIFLCPEFKKQLFDLEQYLSTAEVMI